MQSTLNEKEMILIKELDRLVAEKRWVALLAAMPLNKPYYCHPQQVSDLLTLRATAGRYNNDDNNKTRRVSVNIDFNNAVAKITVTKKCKTK